MDELRGGRNGRIAEDLDLTGIVSSAVGKTERATARRRRLETRQPNSSRCQACVELARCCQRSMAFMTSCRLVASPASSTSRWSDA